MRSLLLLKNEKPGWADRFVAWAYGGYAWAVFIAALLVSGFLSMAVQRPRLGRQIARRGARLMFRLAGIPIAADGTALLPAAPHVVVVNHASFLDGIALTALLPSAPGYAFAVRQEFRSQGLLYPLLKSLGTLVLHRLDVKPAVSDVTRMASLLRRGERLVVFPEGGFRPEPGLQSFHSGSFAAAAKAGVPVVVAALHGTRRVLPPGVWLPRRAPLRLEIGDILYPREQSQEEIARMTSLAQTTLSSMLSGEIRCD